MKKLLLTISVIVLAVASSCAQEDSAKLAKKLPVITFTSTEHDFGTIEQGANGTFLFEFKNTGKDPLVLNHVGTSCGCTVPEWSKEPIKKGKTGSIKVTYDTKRIGSFTKTITVTSNAKNNPVTLKIMGTVNATTQKTIQ